MRILHVHAHFDDFEFVAAGTFEMWRRRLGESLQARVIVCTDGKAGHHFRTRDQTGELRLREQLQSARIGGYQFKVLRLPDGKPPREACVQVSVPLLAALWKAIRDFEPDYLFCPPLAADPLAGVHNDHITVADAVRRVAYMLNVPHAFTPEYPADETRSLPCRADQICQMTWQHQSQIREWIPWVGRHDIPSPGSLDEWSATLRGHFRRRNRELGIQSDRATEVFTVTAWGEVPTYEQLLADLPALLPDTSHLSRLRERLARWRQT